MRDTIKIGLVGYGTVGKGVVKIIEGNRSAIEQRVGASLEIGAICDLYPIEEKKHLYVKRFQDIIDSNDIDIVVELIGGYEPARSIILGALNNGKHVVTANKAVLAKYWDEVFMTAAAKKKLVYFEASVAGAIPVIQGLNEGLAANRISKVQGILNGTTNYILSEMTRNKVSFHNALVSAQKAGFAEANPSFDVQGIDTANKLAILSSLAWSGWIKVEDIAVTGIERVTSDDVGYAGKLGYVLRLIGTAEMTGRGLALSVEPCLVPVTHAFATVDREYNAVNIKGDAVGDVMFYGKGAGQLPAASAVVSDIIFLARHVANGTAGTAPWVTYNPKKKVKVLPEEKREGAFYLRFTVKDQPGVLSRLTGILGNHRVSIASIYQEEPAEKSRRGVPVIILTHRVNLGDLNNALEEINGLSIARAKAVRFRIKS